MKQIKYLIFLISIYSYSQSKGFIIKKYDTINVEFKIRNLINTHNTKNYKLESKIKYKVNNKYITVKPKDKLIEGFCIKGKTQNKKNKLICYEYHVFENEEQEEKIHLFARRLITKLDGSKLLMFMYPPSTSILFTPEIFLINDDNATVKIEKLNKENKKRQLQNLSKKCEKYKLIFEEKISKKKIISTDLFIKQIDLYNQYCKKFK